MDESEELYKVVFHLRGGQGTIDVPVTTEKPMVEYHQFSEGRPDYYMVKNAWGEPVLAEIDHSDVHGWTIEPIEEEEID